MGEAVARFRQVQQEIDAAAQERQRRDAAQGLSALDGIYGDLNAYRPGGALDTPEKQAAFEVERNKLRGVIGVQVQQNFVDPRQGMLVDRIAKGQLAMKSGVGKGLIKAGLYGDFGREYVEQQALNLLNNQAASKAGMLTEQPADMQSGAKTGERQVSVGTERVKQEPEGIMPTGANPVQARPVTSYTADELLDSVFDAYRSPQTSEDEQRWVKVYSTPQGVAMGMQSSEGRERIHAMGKYAFKLSDDLWTKDPAGYASAVAEKNREYNDASRKDKNAALLLKFYDQINESMQQQADPRLLAQQMIAPMQNLGYDGTVAELTEYISSVKSMTAKQTADINNTKDKQFAVQWKDIVQRTDRGAKEREAFLRARGITPESNPDLYDAYMNEAPMTVKQTADVQLNLQKFKETQAWHKIQAADRDADRALRSAQAEVRQNNRSTMTEAQKQGLVFKYRNAANLRRAQIGAKISNGIGGVVPKYDDTTIAQLTAEANALDARADKFEGIEASKSDGLQTRFSAKKQSAIAQNLRKYKANGKMQTLDEFLKDAPKSYNRSELTKIYNYVATRG